MLGLLHDVPAATVEETPDISSSVARRLREPPLP